MAEWLRRGLQILARRFDSGSGLQRQRMLKSGTVPRFHSPIRYFATDKEIAVLSGSEQASFDNGHARALNTAWRSSNWAESRLCIERNTASAVPASLGGCLVAAPDAMPSSSHPKLTFIRLVSRPITGHSTTLQLCTGRYGMYCSERLQGPPSGVRRR